ncbi:MAG: GNAT family N-acetyltransferase [Polyangiaceae bacterium]
MKRADLSRIEEIYAQHAHEAAPFAWREVAHHAIDDESGEPLAWVACSARDVLIGYVIGEVRTWEFGSHPAGWVIGIGIDVAHQNEDIGRDLLARLVQAFASRGTTILRTMVRRDDVKVLRFFRNIGFSTGPYTELEMEVQR